MKRLGKKEWWTKVDLDRGRCLIILWPMMHIHFYLVSDVSPVGGVVTCSTYIGVVLKEERGMYLQIYRGSLNRKKWLKGGEWWGAMQGVA